MMTEKEALTLALKLAITAPTDKQSAEVLEIAESIAVGMDEVIVDQCKATALAETLLEVK
jgi:hypothetical protein